MSWHLATGSVSASISRRSGTNAEVMQSLASCCFRSFTMRERTLSKSIPKRKRSGMKICAETVYFNTLHSANNLRLSSKPYNGCLSSEQIWQNNANWLWKPQLSMNISKLLLKILIMLWEACLRCRTKIMLMVNITNSWSFSLVIGSLTKELRRRKSLMKNYLLKMKVSIYKDNSRRISTSFTQRMMSSNYSAISIKTMLKFAN